MIMSAATKFSCVKNDY